MELNKDIGCWEKYGVDGVDDVAYYLYCQDRKDTLSLMDVSDSMFGWTSLKVENQNYFIKGKDNKHKKYYIKARAIMIGEKINRIKDGI